MMARTVVRALVLLVLVLAGCATTAPPASPTAVPGAPPSSPSGSTTAPALERVRSAQPDLLDARYSLGVVRYAQGDVAGAIDAYRRVLAADPLQPDARYSLALVLKLAQRDAEATPELVTAAEAGHARAQYFAGTAYAAGVGVPRDLTAAVAWWFRAAEQGVPQAE